MMDRTRLIRWYPKLAEGTFRIVGPANDKYNCVAYVLGDSENWWSTNDGHKWHPDVDPRHGMHDSLDSYVELFRKYGYEDVLRPFQLQREYTQPEEGYERIAIYGRWRETGHHQFSHVAKSLPNGKWASKVQASELIEHELDALEGDTPPQFGKLALVMRKHTFAEPPSARC
jgi:hypothetical protein